MTTPFDSVDPVGPRFSQEHLEQLAAARLAMRKIDRAISLARFDGWTIGLFAGLTLLFGWSSFTGILIGVGMGGVAWVEFQGAKRLRCLEVGAGRMLGFNQMALAGMLILYALWAIYSGLNGAGAYAAIAGSDTQLAEMLKPFEGLAQFITVAIYSTLIVATILAQGGMAVFYFSRDKYVQAFRTQTPEWILQMQKAGISI